MIVNLYKFNSPILSAIFVHVYARVCVMGKHIGKPEILLCDQN